MAAFGALGDEAPCGRRCPSTAGSHRQAALPCRRIPGSAPDLPSCAAQQSRRELVPSRGRMPRSYAERRGTGSSLTLNEIRTLGLRRRRRLRDRPLLLPRRSFSGQKQLVHREGPVVRISFAPAESPRLARFCPPTARGRLHRPARSNDASSVSHACSRPGTGQHERYCGYRTASNAAACSIRHRRLGAVPLGHLGPSRTFEVNRSGKSIRET